MIHLVLFLPMSFTFTKVMFEVWLLESQCGREDEIVAFCISFFFFLLQVWDFESKRHKGPNRLLRGIFQTWCVYTAQAGLIWENLNQLCVKFERDKYYKHSISHRCQTSSPKSPLVYSRNPRRVDSLRQPPTPPLYLLKKQMFGSQGFMWYKPFSIAHSHHYPHI